MEASSSNCLFLPVNSSKILKILFKISFVLKDCFHNFEKDLIRRSSSNLSPKALEVSVTPSV